MADDRPTLDLHVRRYGALGIVERDDSHSDVTDDDAIEALRRLLDTMTPHDAAVITIGRRGA